VRRSESGVAQTLLAMGLLTICVLGACQRKVDGPIATMGITAPTPTPAAAVTITAANFSFTPNALTVSVGTPVVFVIGGGSHTVQIESTGGACQNVVTTFPYTTTFNAPGTYHFHCTFHSCGSGTCDATCTGMTGILTVQ